MNIPPCMKDYVGAPLILGMPMNQNRYAVPTWSYAMELHPPKTIVEIGSYNGGFTIALAMHAWHVGAQVYSYDVMEAPTQHWRPLSAALGIHFIRGDVFEPVNMRRIESLIQTPGVTYLLCDGGNKAREFNTFCRFIKPGDIIGAHDFYCKEFWPWSETRIEDVADTVSACGLRRWNEEYFNRTGWLVYQR